MAVSIRPAERVPGWDDPAQLDAFAPSEPTPGAPYVKSSRTSKAAAKRVGRRTHTQRHAVFECVARSPRGLTRKEIAEMTGFSENAVRPRVVELVKLGMVAETNIVRERCAVLIDAARFATLAPRERGESRTASGPVREG
jgi:hypothetical protein